MYMRCSVCGWEYSTETFGVGAVPIHGKSAMSTRLCSGEGEQPIPSSNPNDKLAEKDAIQKAFFEQYA